MEYSPTASGDLLSLYHYGSIVVLILVGLFGLIVKTNLVKKLIGLTILQTAVILFYVSTGVKEGSQIPIIEKSEKGYEVAAVEGVANPLPHVLMLTAIVVGVATLGVGLSLIIRIHGETGLTHEQDLISILED